MLDKLRKEIYYIYKAFLDEFNLLKMFDFEKLEVYKKIVLLNKEVLQTIYTQNNIDKYLQDQLKRSSISIALNLTEGTGRVSLKDKRHFFVMSRASVHESVALIQILRGQRFISQTVYESWYQEYEEISKMLFSMIRNAKMMK